MAAGRDEGAAALAVEEARERLLLRLAETEAWLRLFTSHVPARACATDLDLRVVSDLGAGFPDSPGPIGKTVAELFAASPDRDRVLDACSRALLGEACELDIDDGQAAAHLRLTPRYDSAGRIVGVIGLAFEVTARVRAEATLREAQRLLLEAQRIGRVRSWEEDLRTGLVKPDLASLVEPVAPVPRDQAWRAVPADERARLLELRRRTVEEGLPFETEHRVVDPDGSVRMVVTRGELLRDAAGRPERILGSTVDITDRARVEEEVRSSRRLLQQVLETIPVGVAVMNADADVVLVNPASGQIWGGVIADAQERYPRSKGYWHGTDRRVAIEEWGSQRALRKGETSLNELIDIDTLDGRRRIIQNSAAPLRDDQGAIVGAVTVNEDVTERLNAEEALRRTQRLLVEAEKLGETGSWEHDLVTGEVLDSEENRRLFFGEGCGVGHAFDDYGKAVHPDDRERVLSRRVQLLAGDGSPEIEYRVVWPDGSVHHILGLATVVRDSEGRAVRVYGTNVDVTRRKRAEAELRTLSHRLINAQEAERRAVARELHDDFGQVLTAVKLNLMRKEQDPAESIALVDGAIARMHDLAQDLRPPLLDNLGLAASLRSYAEREARRAGLDLDLDIAPLQRRFPPTVETTCFRVVQEALTNVIRHAGAKRILVRLGMQGEVLRVEVRDDGRGFDPRANALRAESQGLVGMRERVDLAGGELRVESSPGQGTVVIAQFVVGGAA